MRHLVDADPAGYLDGEVAAVLEGLELFLNDRPVELQAVHSALSRPDGEGGMRRLRIDAVLEARLPATEPDHVVEGRFVDGNQPGRVGWREIVVVAAGDASIVQSTAPATEPRTSCAAIPTTASRNPATSAAPPSASRPGRRSSRCARAGGGPRSAGSATF